MGEYLRIHIQTLKFLVNNLCGCSGQLLSEIIFNTKTVIMTEDTCFQIKQSKDKGRYMVATRDIPALDVILVEKAAACGPKLSHTPVCVECFSDININSYVPCHVCGLPFCSEKCRKARDQHTKSECQIFSRSKISSGDLDKDSGVLASVTAVRLLNLRKNAPKVFEKIDILMDNMDHIRCSDKTELGTYSSAMVCRKCKEGTVLPGENLSDNSWQCSNCDLEYKVSLVDNTIKKLKISLEKIPKDDVDKLEAFLKVSSKILHPNHCILVELKQRILQLYGTSLNPELISRKLELADEIMKVMDKLDPGITAWKGKLVYDVTRFRIVTCLQDLQLRKLSPEKVINQLTESVEQLEMAVSGLTGEKFGDSSATLRKRMMKLGGAHILGDGYKMLIGTCLKMPFMK